MGYPADLPRSFLLGHPKSRVHGAGTCRSAGDLEGRSRVETERGSVHSDWYGRSRRGYPYPCRRHWINGQLLCGPAGVCFRSGTDYGRFGDDPIITAITGWPLEHTRSPQMHNAAFRAAGIQGRYVRIPSPAAELPLLPEVLRCYRIRGANVTIPHKQTVMPLLSEVLPEAKSAGAVNTILVDPAGRLTGTNTDIAGISATIAELRITPSNARVLVAGAGGAARAAVSCLTAAGAAVSVTNRTMEKARTLAAEFGATAVPRDEL